MAGGFPQETLWALDPPATMRRPVVHGRSKRAARGVPGPFSNCFASRFDQRTVDPIAPETSVWWSTAAPDVTHTATILYHPPLLSPITGKAWVSRLVLHSCMP